MRLNRLSNESSLEHIFSNTFSSKSKKKHPKITRRHKHKIICLFIGRNVAIDAKIRGR